MQRRTILYNNNFVPDVFVGDMRAHAWRVTQFFLKLDWENEDKLAWY